MSSGRKSSQKAEKLDKCIGYWKGVMLHDQFMISLSVRVLVESTIGYLEDYKRYLDNIDNIDNIETE